MPIIDKIKISGTTYDLPSGGDSCTVEEKLIALNVSEISNSATSFLYSSTRETTYIRFYCGQSDSNKTRYSVTLTSDGSYSVDNNNYVDRFTVTYLEGKGLLFEVKEGYYFYNVSKYNSSDTLVKIYGTVSGTTCEAVDTLAGIAEATLADVGNSLESIGSSYSLKQFDITAKRNNGKTMMAAISLGDLKMESGKLSTDINIGTGESGYTIAPTASTCSSSEFSTRKLAFVFDDSLFTNANEKTSRISYRFTSTHNQDVGSVTISWSDYNTPYFQNSEFNSLWTMSYDTDTKTLTVEAPAGEVTWDEQSGVWEFYRLSSNYCKLNNGITASTYGELTMPIADYVVENRRLIGEAGGNNVVELTQAEYDALSQAGTLDLTALYIITDASVGDLANYYTKTEVDNAITAATSTKQDTLVSGTNIKTINNESILGSGNIDIQGGGSITVDTELSTTSENPVQNKVVTAALDRKGDTLQWDMTSTARKNIPLRLLKGSKTIHSDALNLGDYLQYGSPTASALCITGLTPTTDFTAHTADTTVHVTSAEKDAWNAKSNFSGSYDDLTNKPTIPTVTTSITSSSTDAQVPSAKAVNDQLGGLKLVKLTQSEYDALETKDSSTLYVISG